MPDRKEEQDRLADRGIADLEERLQAVVTPNHAFVNASAGTGKTHTLTLRAIYLLLTVEAERLYSRTASRTDLQKAVRDAMRSLILTTFTKKASAEMQDRVFRYLNMITGAQSRKELEKALGNTGDTLFVRVLGRVLEKVPGEDFRLLQKGARALVEKAPELQITTLHSFANLLLSSYPVEAGIPLDAGFQSEDDPSGIDRESRLFDTWIRREVLAGGRDLSGDLGLLLSVLPLEGLKAICRQCILREWLAGELDRFVESGEEGGLSPEECLETLEAWCCNLMPRKGRISKAKGIAGDFLALINEAGEGSRGSWTRIAALLREHKEYMFVEGKHVSKTLLEIMSELPDTHQDRLREYGGLYRTALVQALKVDSPEAWQAFRRLLGEFVRWGRENLVRETGLVSFDDMISMAAELLGSFPEVQAREYSRLRAVLVDEFQDTDPDQLGLLRNLLTRPGETEREVLGFFVGDVKQSIYRFRNADVAGVQDFQENFQERVKCGRPVDHIRLRTSFRSEPGIIDHANNLFTSLMDLERGNENLLAFKPSLNPVPEWRFVDTGRDNDKALEKRESVARAVLGAIREYMEDDPLTGPEKSRSYRDILVLCRSYKELDPVIHVLKKAGVPVISSGCRTFQMNTEVVDTVNLLIAMLDPLDSLAVASTLKSPIVGLSDAEIFRFFRESDPVGVFAGRSPLPDFVDGGARSRLKAIVEAAVKFRGAGPEPVQEGSGEFNADESLELVGGEEAEQVSGSLNFEKWIRMVDGLIPADAYHRDWDLEGITFARIKKVLEDFRNVCIEAAVAPLAWLLGERKKAVYSKLPEEGFSEDVSLSDESVCAVRVMTMHKAKGLEGRFVIIASWSSLLESSLGIPQSYQTRPVYDFPDRHGCRVRAFSFSWGELTLETANYPEAVELNREMESMEARRLAYVSATRPRERLMMITPAGVISRKNRTDILRLVEEYKQSACGKRMLLTSTWKESGSGTAPPAPDGPGETDPAAYWAIWSSRLAGIQPHRSETPKGPVFPDGNRDVEASPGVSSGECPEAAVSPFFGGSGREIGSLVHLYLEAHITDPGPDRDELESLASIMDPPPGDPAVVDRAEAILGRFYSGETLDEQGIPLRDRVRAARIIARELPVMVEFQGEVQYRVVDLLLEEDDAITIVDFKTGAKPAVMPESYRLQQAAYTRAVEQLAGGRPVRFEFWWT